MRRILLAAAAGTLAVLVGVPIAASSPYSVPSAKPTLSAFNAVSMSPGVTLTRTQDPETHAPGILVTYRWHARFDRKYTARVRLYQDGRLVGQIRFAPGWSKALAFFRTSSSRNRHTLQATGGLLRRDGRVVTGSVERSLQVHWWRTVKSGQIVR